MRMIEREWRWNRDRGEHDAPKQAINHSAETHLFPLRLPRVPLPSAGLVEKSADSAHMNECKQHFTCMLGHDEYKGRTGNTYPGRSVVQAPLVACLYNLQINIRTGVYSQRNTVYQRSP